MATEEFRTHTTPAGGVRSVIRYLDDQGKPADKSTATQAEIIEYGAGGEELRRTYLTLPVETRS